MMENIRNSMNIHRIGMSFTWCLVIRQTGIMVFRTKCFEIGLLITEYLLKITISLLKALHFDEKSV